MAFAVGQLLAGPVSDGIGRRPLMLGGTALFALASLGCALAPDVGTLVVARVVQGLAGAAAAVAGRAMVSDVTEGPRMAKVFGTLAAINAIGPVVAPLAGGAVLLVGTWRVMFVVLAVLGAVFFALVVPFFHETLRPAARGGIGLGANWQRIRQLVADPALPGVPAHRGALDDRLLRLHRDELVRVPDAVRLLRAAVHDRLRHERHDDDRHDAGVPTRSSGGSPRTRCSPPVCSSGRWRRRGVRVGGLPASVRSPSGARSPW